MKPIPRPTRASAAVTRRRRQSARAEAGRGSSWSSSSYSIRAMPVRNLHRKRAAECDNRRDAQSIPPLRATAAGAVPAVSCSCGAPMAVIDELQLLLARATGLARRGVASLRTRGWRHSLERARLQFAPRARPSALPLLAADQRPFEPFAVPCSDAPAASIVIPVHGQWPHTLACLRALAAHPPACAVEMIVVDDASTDGTPRHLPQVAGLVGVRRDANGGFIAACNEGAARARGRFLVFLNNDTVPQPGWLDALLATFDQHPDTGLAGAQLLYPDGRLQEAGGLVFADGSAWNYGRFESPEDPRFSYLRETDYVSAAAAAIPAALF